MLADHLLFAQEKSQYKQAVEEKREQKRNVNKTESKGSKTESRPQSNGAADSLPQQGSLENATDSISSKMEVDLQPASHDPSPPNSQLLMPSGIYGAEHLLRLFVRIPLFLSRAQLPVGHVQTLHHYFKDLLELVVMTVCIYPLVI